MVTIALVTVLIGVLFYALNYYTPLYADDYSYSFSFSTGERMETPAQILDSQIGHYKNTNGRIITHSLAQLFLLAGDQAFNLFNVVFFLLLLYLIYFHGQGTFRRFSTGTFAMSAMLLFLTCPAFGQSFLWITGAANYLYGILIVLCVLIPYRKQANGASADYPLLLEIVAAIVYLALGIIAGWTNENTSVAMIIMIIGYIAFYRMQSIKIHAWNVSGCVGGMIGCILMLTSPGTASRLDSAGGSGGIISWLKRAVFYSCDMVANLHVIILLFAIILTIYIYQNRNPFIKCNKQIIIAHVQKCGIPFIYLVGFLASVYSMVASPEFPKRAWSGPVVILLIAIMSLISKVDTSNIKIRLGKKLTIGFVLVFFLATYVNAFFELKNVNAAYNERVLLIETAVASNESSVEIPNISGVTGYSCYSASGALNADSSKWPNTAIARYYGIEEIICSGE